MPEEIEAPTEQLQETLEEAAHKHHHDGGNGSPSWIPQVALSAALVAVLAAISALLAGHHANEAMLEQIQATDRWAHYQAKGMKSSLLQTRVEIMAALGKSSPSDNNAAAKMDEYAKEQKELDESARELERSSKQHLSRHNVLARAVTLFQVAIAMAAISVLTKKKWLWLGSMGLTVVGAVQALL